MHSYTEVFHFFYYFTSDFIHSLSILFDIIQVKSYPQYFYKNVYGMPK
jgi:hypothetical protein